MQKLIFANWKSQKLANQVVPWLEEVGAPPAAVKLVVMPPTSLLSTVAANLPPTISLGAQNVSPYPLGAYTGEVAAAQLADLGVQFCLVGHSERRRYFGETDDQVVAKCQLLSQAAITPVVCIDEPYLESQLTALQAAGSADMILAYEPINAIGTGHNASLEQVAHVAQQVQQFGDFPFIYGGSVSAETVGPYLLQCDGALIGSASLEAASFAHLLAVAAAQEPSFS